MLGGDLAMTRDAYDLKIAEMMVTAPLVMFTEAGDDVVHFNLGFKFSAPGAQVSGCSGFHRPFRGRPAMILDKVKSAFVGAPFASAFRKRGSASVASDVMAAVDRCPWLF